MLYKNRFERFGKLLAGFGSLSVLLFAGAKMAFAGDPMAGMLYCCVDANGQKACGDTLPRVCFGRGYQMIDGRGIVVREIAPPLSPEERAAREREKKIQEELAAKQKEQERKNRALLSTYGSEQEIDQMRERVENEIQTSIRDSQRKIKDAEQSLKALNEQIEAEPGKGGGKDGKDAKDAKDAKDVPPAQDMKKKTRELEAEIKFNKDYIVSRRKDLDAVRTQYDEIKVRYRELARDRAASERSSGASSSSSR